MTTKEIAEMIFGKIVKYKSKEYASVHRSLISLENRATSREYRFNFAGEGRTKSACNGYVCKTRQSGNVTSKNPFFVVEQ